MSQEPDVGIRVEGVGAARSRESVWPLALLVGLLGVLTPVLAIVTNGNVIVAAAPVLAVGALAALWSVPLRYPTLGLLFLGLTLENPSDGFASGLWKSPIEVLGVLMLTHVNGVIPVKALVFSGVDVMLVLLFTIAFYRRSTRSRLDGPGFLPPVRPLRVACAVTILAALGIEAWGALRGGMDFTSSLWQVQHVVYLPLLFFLLGFAIRGPQDHPLLGKVILFAAWVRALAATLIRHLVTPNSYDDMPYATTHTDSMLFAGAFCLCIVLWIEMPDRRRLLLNVVMLPVLIAGMIANNRRLVWVEIAIALLVLYFVMPMTRFKRRIVRVSMIAVPALVGYLVAGWESAGGALFSVARMVRSVVDSKSDASSEWRDWENFDLIFTLKSSPVVGLGYGHPYIEEIKLPKITYEQEPFVPHNSLLGLWAYGGVIGFTLLWMMIVVGAFFAVRCYRRASRPLDRATALAALLMIVIYLAHCYGDLGLGTWAAIFLVSPALTVVGKLALTTGAWPSSAAPAARGH